MDDETEQTPLERLREAVQEFINATEDDGPLLLDDAVVVFEAMRFTDDDEPSRRISYSSVGRGSQSGTVGLLQHGLSQVQHDLLAGREDDEP